MSTLELLTRLRKEGITLAAEGGQLRLKAPPGVLTTELRNELIANKAEILSLLNDAKAAGRSKPTGIPRIQRKGDLPPSFAQERLWFLDQLEPGTFAYNIPTSFRLQGMLDTAVLERSIGEIVRRHEPLRTVFVTVDGSARQHICPFEGFELSVLDLQGLPKDQQEEQVQRVGFDDARRPFDLRKSPLIRATLLKVAENANVLLINTHHIASDAWSFSIFARELGDIYDAFVHKRPSPLPELPVQYADFAVWQRQWLQGEILETQLAYWKRQLTGVLPVLELPTDRPRPIVRTPDGSTESIILTAPLGKAVKELSRHEGVTLFITLLAAFKILLCRYSGQEDVLVGMPIANRNRAEIEGLIGFFVNTLVARTDLSGNPGFRELLGRVREVALGAYAHQDLPFEKLVTELQPERSTSHAPIYQVAFNLWNTPAPLLKLPGLEPAQLQYHDGGAKEDLSLTFEDSVDGLTARCLYSTDLWDQPSIVRMLIHFQTLLEGIVSNPDQRISDLPLLTQQERHQMLVEWNRTEVDYPDDRCLHELLEEQVERTPEAVAVVFDDTQLTYRQLNETRQPIGALSPVARRAARAIGGRVHGTFAGNGGGAVRHPQSWRRLCAH